MSNILAALKQIESRSGTIRPAARPRPSEDPIEEPAPLEKPVLNVATEAALVAPPCSDEPTSAENLEKNDFPPLEDPPSPRAATRGLSRAENEQTWAATNSIEEQDQAYRDLARNVLAHIRPSRPATLMFTSPSDAEGKTDTLLGLAPVLAELGSGQVVLLDANFRRPEMAACLGVEAKQGLVDVLQGAANWREVVQETGLAGLSLLPGGRFSTDDGLPTCLPDFAPLLDELRRHYRLVLLDTASLSHREVASLSRFCDGTYLVIELGRTFRRRARRAVRLIEDSGGYVLGCVLTGVPS